MFIHISLILLPHFSRVGKVDRGRAITTIASRARSFLPRWKVKEIPTIIATEGSVDEEDDNGADSRLKEAKVAYGIWCKVNKSHVVVYGKDMNDVKRRLKVGLMYSVNQILKQVFVESSQLLKDQQTLR